VSTASTQTRDMATRLLPRPKRSRARSGHRRQGDPMGSTDQRRVEECVRVGQVARLRWTRPSAVNVRCTTRSRHERNPLRQIQEPRNGSSPRRVVAGNRRDRRTDLDIPSRPTSALERGDSSRVCRVMPGAVFSVVGRSQRLADRSAESAKQIGALGATIRRHADAVTAMEKAPRRGRRTKLSDAAGTALADIDASRATGGTDRTYRRYNRRTGRIRGRVWRFRSSGFSR